MNSIEQTKTCALQLFSGDLCLLFLGTNERVELDVFDADGLMVCHILKLDHEDSALLSFCCQWAANQVRKVLLCIPNHIGYLNPSDLVTLSDSLCFKRKNIFSALLVDSDVQIINFDLSFILDRRSNMRLQMKTRNLGKNINEPVISQYREQPLFIRSVSKLSCNRIIWSNIAKGICYVHGRLVHNFGNNYTCLSLRHREHKGLFSVFSVPPSDDIDLGRKFSTRRNSA